MHRDFYTIFKIVYNWYSRDGKLGDTHILTISFINCGRNYNLYEIVCLGLNYQFYIRPECTC